ncbi:MAG: Kelch repeat-containing protein, partial [Acidimicrobiales bacterium]
MPENTPLARRMPGYGARHARHRARRTRALTRLVAVLLAVLVLILIVVWATGSSKPGTPTTTLAPSSANTTRAGAAPAVESGLLPWRLAAPISRTVDLPGSGSQVVILGGLTSGSRSASGIYALDTSNGNLTEIGTLPAALHDAAGALLGGRYLLFGGGAPATVNTVSAFTPAATGKAAATDIGTLPQPRSDAAAVTIGNRAYVVGGYDGTNADPQVLVTGDGSTFSTVASLPVPVRYPALAVSGGKIYVFGGQAVDAAGNPVSAIQLVDPAAHSAKVVGHLPIPLAGAAVVSIGGHIYVVGGESSTPQTQPTGVGATQLGSTGGANTGAGATGAIPDSYAVPTSAAGAPAVLTGDERRAAGTTTTSTLPAASSPTVYPVSTIWSFDPATGKLAVAGRLQVPVSHASATVVGSTAWLVGGETGGTQQSTVQMVTPNKAFGTAGAAGAGSPYFGDKLLVADRGNKRQL